MCNGLHDTSNSHPNDESYPAYGLPSEGLADGCVVPQEALAHGGLPFGDWISLRDYTSRGVSGSLEIPACLSSNTVEPATGGGAEAVPVQSFLSSDILGDFQDTSQGSWMDYANDIGHDASRLPKTVSRGFPEDVNATSFNPLALIPGSIPGIVSWDEGASFRATAATCNIASGSGIVDAAPQSAAPFAPDYQPWPDVRNSIVPHAAHGTTQSIPARSGLPKSVTAAAN